MLDKSNLPINSFEEKDIPSHLTCSKCNKDLPIRNFRLCECSMPLFNKEGAIPEVYIFRTYCKDCRDNPWMFFSDKELEAENNKEWILWCEGEEEWMEDLYKRLGI